jgi:hypothetical protein
VSLLSANDVNLEDIARLAGHSGTAVTERASTGMGSGITDSGCCLRRCCAVGFAEH